MNKYSQERFDVLVIGGGPAGMAAAVSAAKAGVRVGIVDENPSLGGQIWRGEASTGSHSSEAAGWLNQVKAAGVGTLYGKRVFHHPEPGILLVEGLDDVCELGYRTLVLATGARERFLPFPGWTLPNVTGAGGLQALVKSGLPIKGKRVVVAGSGPLLLAVAAYLRKRGAEIPLICEQASWGKLAKFGLTLLGQPGKIVQSLRIKKDIAGVPFIANSWPLAAHGKNALEAVTISRSGKLEVVKCDYLACGFHLVPNVELPLLMGCQTRGGYVQVGDFQQTTVKSIFCAGEPTGIGGVDLALIEGQIAGLAATEQASEAKTLFRKREKLRRFAHTLDEAFCLRSELRSLPASDTLVCRCEDVLYSRLREHTSWRSAKLHTRCGMGPCQGRICGPATQFLFRWNPDSVRPPVFPARVENLAVIPAPQQSTPAVTGGLQ
jgi:NADPH-dependent 2,4-dienoyl-CoA reductase/sulfur reductase-like enzyme